MNALAEGSSALTMPVFGQLAAPEAAHRGDRRRRPVGEPLEETELGVSVRLPRAVELEVLVGEVRDDRHVVGDGVDSAEGEAMRCRLHDGRAVAGDDHGPQCRLQSRGVRCRGMGLVRFLDAADPGCGGAGHPRPDAGSLEGGDCEERGGRLSVCAGDADHAEVAARVAVPPRRCRSEGGRGCGHDELRDGSVGDGTLDDRGRRPGGGRCCNVVMAIDVETGDRHEERPGSDGRGSRS